MVAFRAQAMGGTKTRRPLDFTFRLVPLVLRLLQQKGIDGRVFALEAGLPQGYDTAPEITAPLPKFRMNVKALAACGGLPDYRLQWNRADDSITFYRRSPSGAEAQLKDAVQAMNRKRR